MVLIQDALIFSFTYTYTNGTLEPKKKVIFLYKITPPLYTS